MTTQNEAYTRARLASEKILADAYRAADQLSADVIGDANVKFRQGRIAAAGKTSSYGLASDVRAAAYAEAEQRHRDRLAAIQRHFGQQIVSRGDPDAAHAIDFITVGADPEGIVRASPG
jgi:hypothetical protein